MQSWWVYSKRLLKKNSINEMWNTTNHKNWYYRSRKCIYSDFHENKHLWSLTLLCCIRIHVTVLELFFQLIIWISLINSLIWAKQKYGLQNSFCCLWHLTPAKHVFWAQFPIFCSFLIWTLQTDFTFRIFRQWS